MRFPARAGLVLSFAAGWLVAAAPGAAAQQCVPPGVGYPGDSASQAAIASWMARGAEARSIPGELPVMAALVESNLQNLDYGMADSLGFFQMRTSIWNTGEYEGYPEQPELQLDWFLDYAEATRPAAVDPDGYGAWVEAVLRPPEQARGAYQPRLADARALIRPACTDPAEQGPGGGMVVGDVTPPRVLLRPVLRPRALVVRLRCPAEACELRLNARLAVPGKRRTFGVSSGLQALAAGAELRLRLAFGPRLLDAGAPASAKLRLRAFDAAGNRTVVRRVVRR